MVNHQLIHGSVPPLTRDIDMDTETKIALVSSLLPFEAPYSDILDAIVRCDGDPEAAAEHLQAGHKHSRKRKGLSDWLIQKPTTKEEELSITPPPKKPRSATKFSSSTTNALALLRDASSSQSTKTSPAPLPPLMLATPKLISTHTPCTLHNSILPPELACTIFYELVHASQQWSRNKWYLADRLVESPHRTSFFSRKTSEDRSEEVRHWYNGRQMGPAQPFTPAMEAACEIIEQTVNAELKKRKRFPLEWGGEPSPGSDGELMFWRANVAAANCYTGGQESVGFHSDHLTHLGPFPTIASLSLGVQRQFRLREVIPKSEKATRAARTYNIPLPHNSLVIMHASCQETFKHSIPPQATIDAFHPILPSPYPDETLPTSTSRINVTFRFYRPDFRPSSIPKCKCGIPCVLRPDMKNRSVLGGKVGDEPDRYWWNCYAGAQNEGKGCGMWQVLDMTKENRGPIIGSR